jgi:hypothetical protein
MGYSLQIRDHGGSSMPAGNGASKRPDTVQKTTSDANTLIHMGWSNLS